MGKYISLGKINKHYKHIIFSVFFVVLSTFSYGYNYNNSFQDLRIDLSNTQASLFKHYMIHKIYCFISTFFISLIIYRYESKEEKPTLTIIKIEQYYNSTKIIFLIIFLWVFVDFAIYVCVNLEFLKDLDFWMIELLIIYFFNVKILNTKLYKHQKFSLWLNIIPCILKIITIVLSFINYENNPNNILYVYYIWLIPIGIFVYLIILIIDSYALINIKWLMDLRYIKISKLLIIYGIVGTIFYIIITLLSTFINCPNAIKSRICHVHDKNNNLYYFDNYILYIKNFKGNISEIFFEIVSNCYGVICFFCNKFFSFLIIKYMSPIHIIFLNPLIYLIEKIVAPIRTLIKEGSFFNKNKMQNILIKYLLDISGDIFSILGFMIYLEMID